MIYVTQYSHANDSNRSPDGGFALRSKFRDACRIMRGMYNDGQILTPERGEGNALIPGSEWSGYRAREQGPSYCAGNSRRYICLGGENHRLAKRTARRIAADRDGPNGFGP